MFIVDKKGCKLSDVHLNVINMLVCLVEPLWPGNWILSVSYP